MHSVPPPSRPLPEYCEGGLSTREALRRQQAHGLNRITDRESIGLTDTIKGIAREPMFVLLLTAALLYLGLGDLGEGMLLATFALLTVGLVIVQERRSAKALDALRTMMRARARVIRDGRAQMIDSIEVVPDDLLLLTEGERVPADACLRQANGLSADESLLTGESMPVAKQTLASTAGSPPDEASCAVFSGTLIVSGHGVAQVTRTGPRTRAAAIGASLAHIEQVRTPLQLRLERLVRLFGAAALACGLLLALGYGLLRAQWFDGLLAAIALGMAMLPEEFPMVLTVFLALGAWRLARERVLARRPAVLEALGSATVLCVDKTGTLTENRMSLCRLVVTETRETIELAAAPDPADKAMPSYPPISRAARRLFAYAVLASRQESSDPMDRAVLASASGQPSGVPQPVGPWRLSRDFPVTTDLSAMARVWGCARGRERIAAKGSPEAISQLCHLAPGRHHALIQAADGLARQGLRVLAVARAHAAHPKVRGDAQAAAPATNGAHDYAFTLCGLIAFEDPLRSGAAAAIAQARSAGIAVAMITGDFPATALAMATQAGIDTQAGLLSGADIDRLDDAALTQAITDVRVFARVRPDQKLRLVEAFRRRGETVAMTGDGVNDAPALKAAHIGIAMGVRGTDVAREAAGLVLLDEDFGRIVQGVRLGRRVSDNLRKALAYVAAIHVPIAGLSLVPVLAGLPPLMLPAHVVLTEMVVDPLCTLAFENAPEQAGIMRRPPRAADADLLGAGVLGRGLLQGGCLLIALLALVFAADHADMPQDQIRTVAMIGLSTGNLALVALNASLGIGWSALHPVRAPALWLAAALIAFTYGLALYEPHLSALLHFGRPDRLAVTAATLAAVGAVAASAAIERALMLRTQPND